MRGAAKSVEDGFPLWTVWRLLDSDPVEVPSVEIVQSLVQRSGIGLGIFWHVNDLR